MSARLTTAYIVNFALLFTHEIDSAFWKEWNLFGIPGGIQVFLVLNLLLLIAGLCGFRQVVLNTKSAFACSLTLSAAGLLTFGIHVVFIARGHSEFTLPVSLATLALILLVSLAQLAIAIQGVRSDSPGRRNS